MKICKKCGTTNKDENNFCNSCGSPEFGESMYVPPAAPTAPTQYVVAKKPDFTWFDMLTIFSFVASIIGCFVISLILDPLALAAGIAGFSGGKRNKGLAIAAVVIAAISLLIRLFLALYDNGVIPQWLITGTLD